MSPTQEEKEIGEIIDGIHENEPIKSCKIHYSMEQGVLKSLRIGETNSKMLRILLIICGGNLLSTWFKGGDLSINILKFFEKLVGVN